MRSIPRSVSVMIPLIIKFTRTTERFPTSLIILAHYLFCFLLSISSTRQMTDKYDWEEWDPSSISFRQHMIAGCVAGVAEHVVFFPIDTLRVGDDWTSPILSRPTSKQCPNRLPCPNRTWALVICMWSAFASSCHVEKRGPVLQVSFGENDGPLQWNSRIVARHLDNDPCVYPGARALFLHLRVYQNAIRRKRQQTYPAYPVSVCL